MHDCSTTDVLTLLLYFFVPAGQGKYFSTNPEYAASEYGGEGQDDAAAFSLFVVAVVIGNVVPVSDNLEYSGTF